MSNVGSAIPLAMADTESPSFVRVAPGATVPIPFGSATLGFEAGGRTYELRVEVLSELSGFGLDPADVDARRRRCQRRVDDHRLVAPAHRRAAAAPRGARRTAAARRARQRADAHQPPGRPHVRVDDHQVQPQARRPVHQVRGRRASAACAARATCSPATVGCGSPITSCTPASSRPPTSPSSTPPAAAPDQETTRNCLLQTASGDI